MTKIAPYHKFYEEVFCVNSILSSCKNRVVLSSEETEWKSMTLIWRGIVKFVHGSNVFIINSNLETKPLHRSFHFTMNEPTKTTIGEALVQVTW